MKTKSKLEIAEAVNKIGIPDMPTHVKYANRLAEIAIEEWATEMANSQDHENQIGLKQFIVDAILEGIEMYKSDLP